MASGASMAIIGSGLSLHKAGVRSAGATARRDESGCCL
jgi:hypothetical protein